MKVVILTIVFISFSYKLYGQDKDYRSTIEGKWRVYKVKVVDYEGRNAKKEIGKVIIISRDSISLLTKYKGFSKVTIRSVSTDSIFYHLLHMNHDIIVPQINIWECKFYCGLITEEIYMLNKNEILYMFDGALYFAKRVKI